MSSRVLPARAKLLLVLCLLSTCAGVAAVSARQRGSADAKQQAGAGEATAISARGAPGGGHGRVAGAPAERAGGRRRHTASG